MGGSCHGSAGPTRGDRHAAHPRLDGTLATLGKLGATVVDEVVDYQGIYRLCYIRGPEGILLGLAQQLGEQSSREDPFA